MSDHQEQDSAHEPNVQKTQSSHGTERSREVIIRDDGTKVIRVRKRRRVRELDTEDASKKIATKALIWSASILLVGGLGVAGFAVFCLTKYNKDDYREQLVQRLEDASGAKVSMSYFSASVTDFSCNNVKFTFKNNPYIESVSIKNVKGGISWTSLLGSTWRGNTITTYDARIVLHANIPEDAASKIVTEDLRKIFDFQSIRMNNCSFYVGDEQKPTMQFTGMNGYVSLPPENSQKPLSFSFDKGQVRVGTWNPFGIINGTFLMNSQGSANLALELKGQNQEQIEAKAEFVSGKSLNQTAFFFSMLKVPMESITDKNFAKYINGQVSSNRIETYLPEKLGLPIFSGDFAVDYLKFSTLPVFNRLSGLYRNPHIALPRFHNTASVKMSNSAQEGLALTIPKHIAPEYMAIQGWTKISPDKIVSGDLTVGIPEQLVLRDTGKPHKMYRSKLDGFYWVQVKLAGTVEGPTDNIFDVMDALPPEPTTPTPSQKAGTPAKDSDEAFDKWLKD